MRRTAFVLVILLVALSPMAVRAQSPAAAEPSKVLVVKVDGSIDRTVAAYLRDSIAKAEADGSIVVVQLDTAGTLDQDAVALAQRIHDATVPVIVWVGPAPAKAAGAGLLFMYAASEAVVAPGAGIGPLEPLDLTRPETGGTAKSAIANLANGWARDFGKPLPLAFPAVPVPAQAALDGRIAQFAAASIPDLLDQLDGTTVSTTDGPVVLRTRIARNPGETPVDVEFTGLGPVDRVLHAMASPAAIYVLLVLGFAAIAFELTQPGFGFAGFSGIGMLALGVYGLTVVPSSWLGLGLLVLGILGMTADVVQRRLGPLTATGLSAFVLGSVLAFRDVAPPIRISPWLVGFFAVTSLLYYGFVLTVATQSRERLTSTQRGLVGLVGETRGELKPEGPVFVKGAMWRGRSGDGPIPAGTRVRVRAVDGLVLRVEPDPGALDPELPEPETSD
jgi:membrane-bound serine protease (ClpP class)